MVKETIPKTLGQLRDVNVTGSNINEIIALGSDNIWKPLTKAELGIADDSIVNNHIDDETNPHNVTKSQVGLGNIDNTSDVNKPISTATQTALDSKVDENSSITGATKTKLTYDSKGLITAGTDATTTDISEGSNLYYTEARVSANSDVSDNTSKAHSHTNKTELDKVTDGDHDVRTDNPHSTTKTHIGLGNVNNTSDADKPISTATQTALDDKADDSDLTSHKNDTTNPHSVTKTQVGLSNVPNTDCTNASNISSGTLSSSVLPPVAITDTFTATNETEQLSLIIQKGDICVRTDLNKSYINKEGNNSAMSDWQELMTPTDNVLSVNGETGTVALTTSDISEDTNYNYVTDAEKTIIGNTSGNNTGDQDLSGYFNKTSDDMDDISNGSTYVKTTNDYSDTEKTKLSGIATGAEVNVQSDWTESNSSLDSYIKNKPLVIWRNLLMILMITAK